MNFMSMKLKIRASLIRQQAVSISWKKFNQKTLTDFMSTKWKALIRKPVQIPYP